MLQNHGHDGLMPDSEDLCNSKGFMTEHVGLHKVAGVELRVDNLVWKRLVSILDSPYAV